MHDGSFSLRGGKWTGCGCALGLMAAMGAAQAQEAISSTLVGEVAYDLLMMAGSKDKASVPAGDSPAARVDANSDSSPYYGVPSLWVPSTGGNVVCTGVAIGDRTILTAGHCMDFNGSGASNGTGLDPKTVEVHFNGSARTSTKILAESISLVAEYSGKPSIYDDIAIIKLAADIPAGAPRYSLLPDGIVDPMKYDFRIDFVGYGASGYGAASSGTTAGFTITENLTTKRVGANLVEGGLTNDEKNGDAAYNNRTEIFRYDFEATVSGPRVDDPPAFGSPTYEWYDGNPSHNLTGSAVTLGNNVESMPGPGDSGGPVFVTDASGNLFLAGLTTFRSRGLASVDGGFGSLAGGVWLPSYLKWIESTSGITAASVSTFDQGIVVVPPSSGGGSAPVSSPVPEPSTYALLALSAVGLAGYAARRRARK